MTIKKLIIIIIMGLCINMALSFYSLKPNYKKINYNGTVQIIDINGIWYVGKLLNSFPKKKVLLKINNNDKLKLGDVIEATFDIEFAQVSRNYGGFNYRRYLHSQGIYGITEISNYKKIGEKKDIYYFLGNIKQKCFKLLDEIYEAKYSSFLKGVLFGQKNEIEDEIKDDFRKSSLSHITAISGMHVSYVVLILEMLLSVISIHKKVKNIIEVIVLTAFMMFTGMTPSCIRACLMYSYVLIGKCLNRKSNVFISMLISLIIIVWINVFNLYNTGLWLSFFSSFGIICLSNLIDKIVIRKMIIRRQHLNNVIKYIINCFSISLASQIFIIPIMIYSYNVFSVSFFIPNLLISVVIGPIIILGYVSIFFSYLIRPIALLFSFAERIMLVYLFVVAKYSGYIPFSTNYVVTPNLVLVIIYYVFIFYVLKFSYKHKYSFLRILLNKDKISSFKAIYTKIKKSTIKVLIGAVVFLLISRFLWNSNGDLKIFFIDVGQGDSCLVVTPQNKSILIDGGDGGEDKYDYGKNVILPYLMDRRIRKIDYIIISHFDSDHIGGLFTIMNELRVDKVIIYRQGEVSENYERFIKLVKEKRIKVIIVQKGDRLKIEKDLYIDILWPNYSNVINENILNNNSIVCKLKYKQFSMLFTGDIEEMAERTILKEYSSNLKILNSTVLKVAHHGSKTSSIMEFLETISPQISLIGVGENNKFGHPNEEVLERLESIGCKIYRTDQMGEINLTIDKYGKIKTKKRLP